MKSAWRRSVPIVALVAVYFCAGKLGLSWAHVHASASAVWPASGIALAALLLWGRQLWPGIFLGAFLVNITTQGTVATTLGIATGNTLEALLAAWAINRYANGAKAFERARNIFRFVVLAPILSTAVAATFGITSLTLAGLAQWDQFGAIWLTWWLGDAVGDLIFAPFVVIWMTQPYPQCKPQRVVEAAGLLISLILIGYFIFLKGDTSSPEYIVMLPLLWAAFRFGQRGAVTSALIMSGIALAGTLYGVGPNADADPNESLLRLQAFMGTVAIAAVVLAAVISEAKRAEQRLEVQGSISRILAESSGIKEAAPQIVRVLCEHAGWDLGAVWVMDRATAELQYVDVWHTPAAPAPQFETVTKQGKLIHRAGLPGRIVNAGMPVWIADVTNDINFRRATIAKREGLHGAFGFPIKLGDKILGVVECFSREVREPDGQFLEMVGAIGDQLGRFIEHTRAQDDLREAKDELVRSNAELERGVQERTADLAQANAALLRTIAEQKILEEQLRQAQKMESIGTLAGGIAHDFNNILNIIRGYAMLIGQQTLRTQEIQKSLKVINNEIDRGASVVRQLLTVARKTETHLASTNANDIVLTLNELIQTFPKTITVALNLDTRPIGVLADRNQLNQALLNICVNARDAMPAGGKLTITTEKVDAHQLRDRRVDIHADAWACIVISDTGIGMEEEVRTRMFEPFFTTKGVGEGSGLGLAMVYGIVKEHNGFIAVESEPGRGTTFRLYLPMLQSEEKPAVDETTREDPSDRKQSNRLRTVLVVEDEEPLVHLLKKLLPQAGYRVLAAMDGEEALEVYNLHKAEIDIVLLDLGLPTVTGMDVIPKLKEQNPAVNIVIATGYLEPELKAELFRAGVKDCIYKPYYVNEVLEKLTTVIENPGNSAGA